VKLFAGKKEDSGGRQRKKVGVFFCGALPIGYERCRRLTVRKREITFMSIVSYGSIRLMRM
jgi:hypothetical protein